VEFITCHPPLLSVIFILVMESQKTVSLSQDQLQERIQGETKVEQKPSILKEFPKKAEGKKTLILILGSVAVVLAGVATGYFLSGRVTGLANKTKTEVAPGAIKEENEAGVADPTAFPDQAEGTLVVGGIKGEGTHHLDLGLGEDKYVYLTSTVIDLQGFVGKKVRVWGETVAPKHAGWLMDVGKIKVIE